MDAVFTGIRPAAVGLIAAAALLLINGDNFIDYKSYLLFAIVLLFVLKKWLHPILLIILAGISGLILY